jgi:hypothetical protein
VDALAGPFAAAGALLALGGAFKVVRPLPTAGALRAVGAPGPVVGVRMLGAGEAVLGVAAVLTGAPALAALVAAAYLSFAAFVIVAMRGGTALQSCGCFGEVETPPSAVHVLLNAGFASTALASESESALRRLAPPTVTTVLSDGAWDAYGVPGAPYFVLVDGATGDVVGEGSGSSWDQVRDLLAQAMADAGLAADRGRRLDGGPVAARARRDGAAREARVDADLRAAGIGPDDPSLRPEPLHEREA